MAGDCGIDRVSQARFAVRVRLFGLLRETAGVPVVEVEVGAGCTVSHLKSVLSAHALMEGPLNGVAVALNRRHASDSTIVCEGDELALIPPVAGG